MRGPQSGTPVLLVSAERPDLTPEVNAPRSGNYTFVPAAKTFYYVGAK